MNQPFGFTKLLTAAVDELSDSADMRRLFHHHRQGDPLPSGVILGEIIDLCRAVLFPGYYGKSNFDSPTAKYRIGVDVERIYQLLARQVEAGLCFVEEGDNYPCEGPNAGDMPCAEEIAAQLISRLPHIRRRLATDVEAAFLGDPAAQTYGEVISCYPVIKALTNYRVAHELHRLGVPLIPRIITEMAHSETGIDIHPAAEIGDYFTIDHGTGVVIGATCIIGNHVKLYQGVTLGAKSFPLDGEGHPIKNIPRHPILEDNVVVYSNATILGRITIGHDAVVGGNIWVTQNVPAGTQIVQHRDRKRENTL